MIYIFPGMTDVISIGSIIYATVKVQVMKITSIVDVELIMLFLNGAMLYDVRITFPAAIAIVDDDDDDSTLL